GIQYFSLHFIVAYTLLFFFFFQAEDGIRDGHVTGVQTCALPISSPVRLVLRATAKRLRRRRGWCRPGQEKPCVEPTALAPRRTDPAVEPRLRPGEQRRQLEDRKSVV